MFQMMADTARLTHTGRRNDYLRCLDKVNTSGFVTGNGRLQAWKTNGIHTVFDHFQILFPETLQHIFIENIRCLDSKWTIYIYFKILERR